jgi:hypothetical protein
VNGRQAPDTHKAYLHQTVAGRTTCARQGHLKKSSCASTRMTMLSNSPCRLAAFGKIRFKDIRFEDIRFEDMGAVASGLQPAQDESRQSKVDDAKTTGKAAHSHGGVGRTHWRLHSR